MTSGIESPIPAPRRHPRWLKAATVLAALLGATCFAVALSDSLAAWVCTIPRRVLGAREFESSAIFETQYMSLPKEDAPSRWPVDAVLAMLRTRMLSRSTVAEIVRSGRVNSGCSVDPADTAQLEAVYGEVVRRCRFRAVDSSHVEVACHGPDPEWNASLVNGLTWVLRMEDLREDQRKAGENLKTWRSELAAAQARLSEIESQIRESVPVTPWLRDGVSDIESEYEKEKERLRGIAKEVAEQDASLVALRQRLAAEMAREGTANPAQKQREDEVQRAEKVLERRRQRAHAVQKRVWELHVLVQRAPDLLGERKRLADLWAKASQEAEEIAKKVRAAEKEAQRLCPTWCNSQFSVIEYARPEWKPFEPWEPEIAAVERGAWIAAGALFFVTVLIWLPTLRAAWTSRRRTLS